MTPADDIDDDDLRWEDVGPSADWNLDSCRSVAIGARRIAVFHLADDSWRAIKDRCPHNGLPLADGAVHDGHVICPYHGWSFELDTGAGPGGNDVATYPVRLSADGQRVEVGV